MTPEELKSFRDQIDALDDVLLPLISKRARLVQEVGRKKHLIDAHVFRPEREVEIIERLITKNTGPLSNRSIAIIWLELISASRALESVINVGLTPDDKEATLLLFGHRVNMFPSSQVNAIAELFCNKKIDVAVLLCAEKKDNKVTLYAHNMLLLLMQHKKRIVAELNMPENKEDDANVTIKRYVVIGDFLPNFCGYDKTSILVRTSEQSELKRITARYNLKTVLWHNFSHQDERWCWLDFAGHIEEVAVEKGIEAIKNAADEVVMLGSYPLFDSLVMPDA